MQASHILLLWTTLLGTAAASASAACRIVDFGADTGGDFYRGEPCSRTPADVDGDGRIAAGEAITGWPLRFDIPLNPRFPEYDESATSAVFYGGLVGFGLAGAGITEGLNNQNHELRDDFNAMAQAVRDDQQVRACALYFWDKRSFLNGGDTRPVSFDEESSFGPHISRFLNGLDDARWVVRDGDQFYISEARFADESYFPDASRKGLDTTYRISPTATAWAPYRPQAPHDFAFDAATATFARREFRNVTAVGFYLARNRLATGSQWVKWYAFEAVATVTPGPEALPMVPASAAVTVSARTVPYALWNRIWRNFASNAFCRDRSAGYVFESDGDMGSMDLADGPHSADEPATDMTWLDAVVWCNALSEHEGREPCYYADEARTIILRRVMNRDDPAQAAERPTVYWKRSATGYRLPTAAEWAARSRDGTADEACREWCWDQTADVADAGPERTYAVLGRDRWSAAPIPGATPLRYGETPAEGSFRIGFRVARGPHSAALEPPTDAWAFTAKTLLPPRVGARSPAPPTPTMLPIPAGGFTRSRDDATVTLSDFSAAATETTFAQWSDTFQWAVQHGYRLNADGDMGSMDHAPGAHTPDEPVTDVCWEDMVLWCNALSEQQGLTPCYTTDEARSQVLRQALPFRVAMWQGGRGYPVSSNAWRNVTVRWHADGFRLPTQAEWQHLYREGQPEADREFPWRRATGGDTTAADLAAALERGWLGANSGDTTHPVGQRTPNAFGVYDLDGNVSERVWDWPGFDYYRANNPKGDDRPGMFGKAVMGSCFGSRTPQPVSRYISELPSVPRPIFGFRVVRCAAGVHPVDEAVVLKQVLPLEPATFDPLDGRVARGNLRRDGNFAVKTAPTLRSMRWEFKAGGAVRSGAVVADGLAVFGCDDGTVQALDAATGVPRWAFATKGPVRASVAMVGGVVYAASHDRSLYALNVADGTLRWQHTGRAAGTTAPAVAYGVVFAGYGYGWSGQLFGLDAESGREVWRYRLDTVNGLPNGMALDGERLFTPVDDIHVVSVDLRTEYRLWKHPGIPTRSTVPVVDGRVFYAGEDRLTAVDSQTGKRLWSWYPKGPALRTTAEREPTSSPAVADGVVFQGWFNGQVSAVSAEDGALRWVVQTAAPIMASPAVADELVFIANDDGVVLALDAATGAERARHVLPGPARASPWVAEGLLVVGCDDGTVRALE